MLNYPQANNLKHVNKHLQAGMMMFHQHCAVGWLQLLKFLVYWTLPYQKTMECLFIMAIFVVAPETI
jgi:hypothetical protein